MAGPFYTIFRRRDGEIITNEDGARVFRDAGDVLSARTGDLY